MMSRRYRIARWMMRHRLPVAIFFCLATLGFAAGLPRVQLQTIFSDLLPRDDPFVQVYKDHPNFGNPLTVTLMGRRRDGDIYNAESLEKGWQITRDADLTGWVYTYESQMFGFFAGMLASLTGALILYMRNVVGVVTPIVPSAVPAVWGFGFVGWVRSPIEPLLMIVPLLLVARSLSHCVQFTERYFEVYAHVKDRVKAAEITMGVMMAPSVLGIFTDIVGIFLIALAPIPAMQRFALFCGFWAIWLIPTGVFLISLLLTVLPPPKNVARITGSAGEFGVHRIIKRVLTAVSTITYGKRARYTSAIVIVCAVFAVYTALQIRIGNPTEGSNLLWDDSEFNPAVMQIHQHFPGVNTLEVVFEGKNQMDPNRVTHQADTVLTMLKLQNLIDHAAAPPRATLSIADYFMEGNRLFAGGNPKWLPLDPNDAAVNAAAQAVMLGRRAKAFSNVVDFEQENGTVSLWYQDNKQGNVASHLKQVGWP